MKRRQSAENATIGTWTVADLGAFFSKNRSSLVLYAARVLGDNSRAEEVVQDSLIRVILASPELSSEDHARAYFYRTIENLSIDIQRQEGRRPKLVVLDEIKPAELEFISRQQNSLVEAISAAEDAAVIRQALSLLSPAERTALVMWEIDGRSREEISHELGIKASSVRHTLTRARASLRRVLSELVIDDARGLTALELLSSSYRGASGAVKKSSRVALSFLLILIGLFGFNSISEDPANKNLTLPRENIELAAEVANSVKVKSPVSKVEILPTSEFKEKDVIAKQQFVKSKALNFPGLDSLGIPTGFTVADSSGNTGSVFFFERPTISNETEFTIGQIFKTEMGAANILISQALTTDSAGFSFRPTISFSRGGYWIPLNLGPIATDVSRLSEGNYLFTAYVAVESEIESPIRAMSSSNGRDLLAPPKQVIIRLVMNPSKTRVLSQAVLVVERGGK